MHNFCFLLKSYSNDFALAKRLLLSLHAHNKDDIPVYISVPKSDYSVFREFAAPNVYLLIDEDICSELATSEVAGFTPGYINQEIIKLSFWEQNRCKNYFCIDSDAVLIRDFYYSDFMYDETTPYTPLIEDSDLVSDPKYYADYWQPREVYLRKIQKKMSLAQRKILTVHGNTTLSAAVLKSLKENFLIPNNLSYLDLVIYSPYEFSWYAFWLQKNTIIPIHLSAPMIKTFHMAHHVYLARLIGISEKDLARGYVGYVVNSNFMQSLPSEEYEKIQPRDSLARLVPFKILSSALGLRAILNIQHFFARFLKKYLA
ncbi:DUF6492 family protein [Desulfovibrio sp. QI0430]